MSRPAHRLADTDPPIVCRLTPDGDVICEPAPIDASVTGEPAALLEAAITKVFPGAEWGPERTRLAIGLIEAIANAKLPNDRVPRRAGQCIGAVQDLLLETPPSMLLFNYSQQPGDVMGAWYLNQAKLMRMQQVLRQFEHTVAP
jgi:hypothetical protein